jgi:hypothetical protein
MITWLNNPLNPRTAACALLLPFLVPLLACGLSGSADQDASATIAALEATISAMPTPPPTPTPTQPGAQPTLLPAAPAPEETSVPPTQIPVSPLPPTPPGDLEQKMQTADILLYEDIAGNPEVFRYVLAALERLNLPVYDVGDAPGRLKERLLNGTESGEPWDLIIIAAEDRESIQGEYFEIIEKLLDQGQSMILEAWYLDQISQGTAKPILLKCGVEVAPWFLGSGGSRGLEVHILDADHPVFNEAITVTGFEIADYWFYDELGDLMYLSGTGDALFLAGTTPGDITGDGVLTECYGGRLILQTFSTHNYMDETMVPLWMNYIKYALRVHFTE